MTLTGSGAPIWAGPPADCTVCHQSGVPVMTEDGWRMPVHKWWNSNTALTCPGSLAAMGLG